MIKAFTASPKRFDKLDFDLVGSGSGAMRYAFGMHFGEQETAEHYHNTYKDFKGADLTHTLDNSLIQPGSIADKVAEFLLENPSHDLAKEQFNDNHYALKSIDKLITEDDELLFESSRGVMYEATLPIDEHNLPHWNDEVYEDDLNETVIAYYQNTLDLDDLNQDKLSKLEISSDHDDFESLMDEIFEIAYEKGLEEDLIPYHVDEDELKSIFWRQVRGDNHTVNDYQNEFDEGIDQKYLDLVKDITKNDLVLENEMTQGDVYSALSHAFNPDEISIETNIEGKKLASEFLSETMEIPGYRAPTMFGRQGAEEIIIIDKNIANRARLEEITPGTAEDKYETDFSY